MAKGDVELLPSFMRHGVTLIRRQRLQGFNVLVKREFAGVSGGTNNYLYIPECGQTVDNYWS